MLGPPRPGISDLYFYISIRIGLLGTYWLIILWPIVVLKLRGLPAASSFFAFIPGSHTFLELRWFPARIKAAIPLIAQTMPPSQ